MKRTTLFRLLALLCGLALIAAACGDDDDTAGDDDATTEEPSDDETSETDCEVDDADGDYDWSNVCRRQAVSMGIDRQAIVDAIFLGSRAPGDDFWPPTFAGYRGDCENLQYNPERAAELWEAAGGTKDGAPFTIWFNSGAGHEEWTEAAGNQLKDSLGIPDVAFESLEFADYLQKLDEAEVNGPFRLGWLMDYPSPGNFLGPIHSTAGSSNNTGFTNEEFDELVNSADAQSVEDAVADYQAAGDILCEEVPIAPMFFGLNQVVWSENVENVSHDAFQALNLVDVTDVDGDGSISVYICEPEKALVGVDNNETCGSETINALYADLFSVQADGEIVFDGIAASIESDDDQNWTLTLNEGWTFHDGTPVTAQHVADTWNWGANAANAAENSYFFSIPGIEGYGDLNPPDEDGDGEPDTEVPADAAMSGLTVVDDLTLEIALEGPFAQLPLVMGYPAWTPVHPTFFDDPAGHGQAPIGTGPFMMDPAVNGGAWEHDVQVATVAYPEYAGEAPSIEKVVYQIYNDVAVAYAEAQANNLDVVDTVPTANLGTFKDDFADRFLEEETSSFNYLGFPIDLELVSEWHAAG